ncbi:MAG: hypothetical protein LC623_00665 [Halobacteriales archaeon]|nr:hypothetical protein [Halobacteriales archaeon]
MRRTWRLCPLKPRASSDVSDDEQDESGGIGVHFPEPTGHGTIFVRSSDDC